VIEAEPNSIKHG